ncbi:hypothetical protein LIA77_07551 [Sarocladium implicatum]|nr:hypothetical protein LIA77_07551 [Sarocladium implicatum]
MPSPSDNDEVRSSMNKLTISPPSAKSKAKSKAPVADSWEDEDVSDGEPAEPKTPRVGTSAPPPTPINPNYTHQILPASASSRGGDDSAAERRPEKTDAVARRMIAAGLGLKAPKQTEEQKAYQRSIREQEKKKREQEKADEARRQEEVVKAKAAIWDD